MPSALDVVIPVGPGSPTLPRCLGALDLALATFGDPANASVFLIGDRVPGATPPETVTRHIWVETGGSVADRRNVGFRAGGAPYVLFLDSDVYLEADALRQLREAIERDGHPLAAGATPLTERRTRWGEAMARMPFGTAMEFAGRPGELAWTPTTALLARRDAMEADPFVSLAPPRDCGEDVALGTGLTLRTGRPAVACTGTVIAEHDARAWDERGQALERAWRFGRGEASLLDLFPDNSMPRPPLLPWLAWASAAAIVPWGWLAALVVGLGWAAGAAWRHGVPGPHEVVLRAVFALSASARLALSPHRRRRFVYHPGQVLAAADRCARTSWGLIGAWVVLAVLGVAQ